LLSTPIRRLRCGLSVHQNWLVLYFDKSAVENILLRLLAEPGSTVVVEAPTYSRAIDILCLRNVEIIEIPMGTGGYTIWVRLKGKSAGEDEIIKQFIDHKVAVLPGSSYFYGASEGMFFRISIAHLDEETIEEGIRRLGMGLNGLCKRLNKRR